MSTDSNLPPELRNAVSLVKTITQSPSQTPPRESRRWLLLTVSQNTNSFGLRGFIFMCEDGTAIQCGGNHLLVEKYPPQVTALEELPFPVKETGVEGYVPKYCSLTFFNNLGFEIPQELPKCDNQTTLDEVKERLRLIDNAAKSDR